MQAADFRGKISFIATVVLCWSAICGVGGCSGGYGPSSSTEGLQNLQPVSGSVSFQGQPTPGAVVLFFREGKIDARAPRIAGIVEEDGSFEMSTTVSEGTLPGVQEGKYVVTISWTKKINPDDRDSDDGPDLLPEMYKAQMSSPLRADVKHGDNDLEAFELKE